MVKVILILKVRCGGKWKSHSIRWEPPIDTKVCLKWRTKTSILDESYNTQHSYVCCIFEDKYAKVCMPSNAWNKCGAQQLLPRKGKGV